MATIDKNPAPTAKEIEDFLGQVDFNLPEGFINFFKNANGADISAGEKYVLLWALTDMIQLNKEYNVEEYAPDLFIFGSDGSDTVFAIEKITGYIYEIRVVLLKSQRMFDL